MIKAYLRLSRISIASITGLAPVMGAIAINNFNIFNLLLLFFIGFFGHAYGMTQNDIMDYKIDKKVSEVSNRPVANGIISIKQAWIFGLICILLMFVVAIIIAILTKNYISIFLLFIPIICVTLYNIYSKKIPFADILLAIGMFFFIFYGAFSQQVELYNLPQLVWIICSLGSIQMLSINVIAGGFKDIVNDARQGAKTGAMVLGLNINKNKIKSSKSFKIITYILQMIIIIIAYLPFILIPNFVSSFFLKYVMIALITFVSFSTIVLTWKYLNLKYFEREKIRMLFNLQGIINFTLAPILLMSVTPFALFIIPIPGIGFFIATILFHEKFMRPTNM